ETQLTTNPVAISFTTCPTTPLGHPSHHLIYISSTINLPSSLLNLYPKPTPAIELLDRAGEVPVDLLGPAESMSYPDHAPPPPPPLPAALQPPLPLYKQRSWSPDIIRNEAWLRRKGKSKNRRSKSVTDEDLDELRACIELGFGFDSLEIDQRLSNTLPALGLYQAVNKNYNHTISKYASSPSAASDCDSISSAIGSPHAIFGPGDKPQMVKTKLRQWAQVVACSLRQSS
ncbi:hypothetical protein Goari_006192, partial [Gossypium aridum]|nr:hypothetical protein [Gossypium aridum]